MKFLTRSLQTSPSRRGAPVRPHRRGSRCRRRAARRRRPRPLPGGRGEPLRHDAAGHLRLHERPAQRLDRSSATRLTREPASTRRRRHSTTWSAGLDDRIRLGFAHFPQPGSSEADRKHYLYRRAPGQANPALVGRPSSGRCTTDDVAFGRWVVDGDNSELSLVQQPDDQRARPSQRLSEARPRRSGVTTTIYTNNIGGNGQRLRFRFTALPANTLGATPASIVRDQRHRDQQQLLGGDRRKRSRNQTRTITLTMVPAYTDDGDPAGHQALRRRRRQPGRLRLLRPLRPPAASATILDWTRFSDCGESVLWEPNENNATGTNSSEGQFAYPTEA